MSVLGICLGVVAVVLRWYRLDAQYDPLTDMGAVVAELDSRSIKVQIGSTVAAAFSRFNSQSAVCRV